MANKITKIKLFNIFGDIVEIKGTIIGERTHGFNLESGAWSLYPDKNGTSTPAKFIIFREYRKRRPIAINKNELAE
jgi:hypothetical protein